MSEIVCPKCSSPYGYEDNGSFVCPECAHEWTAAGETSATEEIKVVKDSVGNVLKDGDDVIVVQTMKVKGAQEPLKVGTKVKGIRLVEGDHDIDCKIPGFGAMKLKSSIVRKA